MNICCRDSIDERKITVELKLHNVTICVNCEVFTVSNILITVRPLGYKGKYFSTHEVHHTQNGGGGTAKYKTFGFKIWSEIFFFHI